MICREEDSSSLDKIFGLFGLPSCFSEQEAPGLLCTEIVLKQVKGSWRTSF